LSARIRIATGLQVRLPVFVATAITPMSRATPCRASKSRDFVTGVTSVLL